MLDEPRPGAPRKVSDADAGALVTCTLESLPRTATHWSTRPIAKASGVSRATVSRIWRTFEIKPHWGETLNLSQDSLVIEKVRDIAGLCPHPPEGVAVLFVDEGTPIPISFVRLRRPSRLVNL